MMHWTLLQPAAYEALRWTMISLFEGVSYRPYVDSVGWVTIGIGFKIQDASDPCQGPTFDALGLAPDCPQRPALQAVFDRISQQVRDHILSPEAATERLQSECDAIMSQALGAGHCFSLGETATKGLFTHEAPRYEAEVDQWQAGVPRSRERLALFSLSWNGVLMGSPSLRRAVSQGQRPEAWYQIRYNSNGGAARSLGIAARRACEGSLFGLYENPAQVTALDSQAVLATMTRHRVQIDAQEKAFPNAVAQAREDYAPLLPALPLKTVPTLEQALAPAQAVPV